MKRGSLGLALIAALGMSMACDLDGPDGAVEVRLENASQLHFSLASLYTLDGVRTFADLKPGSRTPYIEVSTAYRIATTEVIAEADTLRVQVIDFVGEQPLSSGRYTYVLSVSLEAGERVLRQELRDDS